MQEGVLLSSFTTPLGPPAEHGHVAYKVGPPAALADAQAGTHGSTSSPQGVFMGGQACKAGSSELQQGHARVSVDFCGLSQNLIAMHA